MTQMGKLMPNLDQQSTKVLNLTVLQRIDPFVEEILMTAAHVTLYQFNTDVSQWSRKDVEGSLFVIKRNTQPRFQFMVMNRRNTDNLVEDLLGDFEYEVQVPYLLYRNAVQEVNGIWFYNSQDCEAVANLFSRILSAYSKVPPKPKVSSNKSEYEELEAVPSLSVIEGPLEPSTSTASAPVPDDSYLNFFTAALNIGNAPNASSSIQLPLSSAPVALPTHPPSVIPSVPLVQSSSSIPTSCSPLMPPLAVHESIFGNTNHATNLVKPSLFSPMPASPLAMPLLSSSVPSAPPLHPSVTMQRPYGAPLLQPFPPPNPSASLTPVPYSNSVITRDEIRDVLLRLVQKDDFIDMIYREMVNMHQQ